MFRAKFNENRIHETVQKTKWPEFFSNKLSNQARTINFALRQIDNSYLPLFPLFLPIGASALEPVEGGKLIESSSTPFPRILLPFF